METVARTFLIISVTVLCVLGARWLYQRVESFAYEAYVPVYIEVPVFIPAWREAATEVATSSATSTIP